MAVLILLAVGVTLKVVVKMPRKSRKRLGSEYESSALLEGIEVEVETEDWTPETAIETLQQSFQDSEVMNPELVQQASIYLFQRATTGSKTQGPSKPSIAESTMDAGHSQKLACGVCLVCGGAARSRVGQ